MFENLDKIRLIGIQSKDIKEFDTMVSKVDSNKLIEGTVDFGEIIDKETGEKTFYYKAYSRM